MSEKLKVTKGKQLDRNSFQLCLNKVCTLEEFVLNIQENYKIFEKENIHIMYFGFNFADTAVCDVNSGQIKCKQEFDRFKNRLVSASRNSFEIYEDKIAIGLTDFNRKDTPSFFKNIEV